MSGDPTDPAGAPPVAVIRVERGNPTPSELAAVVAVLAARASAGREAIGARTPPRSDWSARAALHRAAVTVGPGGWRGAARPR